MVECSNILEEPTDSVFRVAKLIKVDAEVIQRKNPVTQDTFRVSGQSLLRTAVPSQWQLTFPRVAFFSGFTNAIWRSITFGIIQYLDLVHCPYLK
jgi:hypothetical protein